MKEKGWHMTRQCISWVIGLLGILACVGVLVVQVCAGEPSGLTHRNSFTFGIEYEHPEKYVVSGTQTMLTDEQFADI